MLLSALIARVGLTVVEAQRCSMAGNLSLAQVGIGGIDLDTLVGAGHHCRAHVLLVCLCLLAGNLHRYGAGLPHCSPYPSVALLCGHAFPWPLDPEALSPLPCLPPPK